MVEPLKEYGLHVLEEKIRQSGNLEQFIDISRRSVDQACVNYRGVAQTEAMIRQTSFFEAS